MIRGASRGKPKEAKRLKEKKKKKGRLSKKRSRGGGWVANCGKGGIKKGNLWLAKDEEGENTKTKKKRGFQKMPGKGGWKGERRPQEWTSKH